MKITEVEALHLRVPEVKEESDGTQDVLLVRVRVDGGICGLGEIASCSHVGRAVIEAPRSTPHGHGLAAILCGRDVEDVEELMEEMVRGTSWYGPGAVTRHAISGVDMALWDIRAKLAGKPIRKLLNPDAADSVPSYASVLWPREIDQIRPLCDDFIEQGYSAVKFGWGPMGPDAELDEQLVATAREALGPDRRLMVDAGRAWDAETALERIERFQKYDLTWLEEPLDPYDTAGFAEVTRHSSIPIATGETLTLVQEYEPLLREGGIQIVQPDLGRAGGFTCGRTIEAIAAQTGARMIPHAFGTGVLLAASAQWTAASEEPLTEFTRMPSPLAQRLVKHTLEFRDGFLFLSDAPGFGVELDESVVEDFLVA
jgi:L-alanine-DL-glutamate epimerase-like enolase superfamily enzyme